MDTTWLRLAPGDVRTERLQAEQEGRQIEPLLESFEDLGAEGRPVEEVASQVYQEAVAKLLDTVQRAPMREDYPYDEPSDLEPIRDRRRAGPGLADAVTADALLDRLRGAWAGRCAGCLLGKPVEGWRRDRMYGYLRDLDRFPLDRYFEADVPEEVKNKYQVDPSNPGFIENVEAMPEDDDTNYTVTGLAVVRTHGPDFSSEDVADFWLRNIPLLHTCTAERIAYRNVATMVLPSESASFRNPYREWIGAQIRADAFGYLNPGDPAAAAEWAWRDARLSHIKNGIYGEMWAAATIAAAFCTDDPKEAMLAGLAQIPENSRLVQSIDKVIEWHEAGVAFDDASERVHAEWDEHRGHDWCHTISNAMIVAIGLLWGEGDFALSICRSVQPCFDTDCNGATVGSIMGALLGYDALPEPWLSPMKDTLITGVAGYHRVKISEMAELTQSMIAGGG
ncbi:MAG: ADP-ribosylglycohydrolase family protein [Armatimonadia bacterium]|nr:ADP-ribosylglycohydrolase family protein [Armatimonadia bacterium]